jgi:NADPH:quinone reductase-like Zn-dependent oxidoreductase
MPRGSRVLVYGAVSQEACRIDPREFIFKDSQVEGFWLPVWFGKQNPARQLQLGWQAQTLARHELKTEVRERVPLDRANEALEQYAAKMTGGKILLMPHRGHL